MTKIPLVGLFENVLHFADRTDITEKELQALKDAAEKEAKKKDEADEQK